MSNLCIVEHPLVQSKLALLRNKDTNNKEFRELVSEISALLFYEATKDMGVKTVNVDTPRGNAICNVLNKEIGVVPILRGGLGMV
ncbi:MAG: uracil phosphoribosyltransferase, partial [Clostridia bacterium]|nr:uracil phosphoribosyltransferase [Clostridia bacterium]